MTGRVHGEALGICNEAKGKYGEAGEHMMWQREHMARQGEHTPWSVALSGVNAFPSPQDIG